MKTQHNYRGVAVVMENPTRKLNEERTFLINALLLYAKTQGREIKVVFFNGADDEIGAAFLYKRPPPTNDNQRYVDDRRDEATL